METTNKVISSIERVFAKSPLALVISKPDGLVLWANTQFLKLTNQTNESIDQKPLAGLMDLHYNNQPLRAAHYPHILAHQTKLRVSETFIMGTNDSNRLVEFTSISCHELDPPIVVSCIRDLAHQEYLNKLILLKNCSPEHFLFEHKLGQYAEQKNVFLAIYKLKVATPEAPVIAQFLVRDIFLHLHTVYPIYDFLGWIDSTTIGFLNPAVNDEKSAHEHADYLLNYLKMFYDHENYDLGRHVTFTTIANQFSDAKDILDRFKSSQDFHAS